MKYRCYGIVTGSKYLGTVEAENKKEAEDKAWKLDTTSVNVCHQCSDEVDSPEIQEIAVETDD